MKIRKGLEAPAAHLQDLVRTHSVQMRAVGLAVDKHQEQII